MNVKKGTISWLDSNSLLFTCSNYLHLLSKANKCLTMHTHVQVSRCTIYSTRQSAISITLMRLLRKVSWTGTPNCKIEMTLHWGYTQISRLQSSIVHNSSALSSRHLKEESRTCKPTLMITIVFFLHFRKLTLNSMNCLSRTTIEDSTSTTFFTRLTCGRTSRKRFSQACEQL